MGLETSFLHVFREQALPRRSPGGAGESVPRPSSRLRCALFLTQRHPPPSPFFTRTVFFKAVDSKILEGISRPTASASVNLACCCRQERIVAGTKKWKISVCPEQERALQSTSRCAARSCPGWHKQQCFSQRTSFHCGKINLFIFSFCLQHLLLPVLESWSSKAH